MCAWVRGFFYSRPFPAFAVGWLHGRRDTPCLGAFSRWLFYLPFMWGGVENSSKVREPFSLASSLLKCPTLSGISTIDKYSSKISDPLLSVSSLLNCSCFSDNSFAVGVRGFPAACAVGAGVSSLACTLGAAGASSILLHAGAKAAQSARKRKEGFLINGFILYFGNVARA